ncbi:unnamed protein product [Caenorhabditis sp. 36 PRJEB53466]|nr:unnamed protein product [Caenorhabditis sp. 36 PRJEB53466]
MTGKKIKRKLNGDAKKPNAKRKSALFPIEINPQYLSQEYEKTFLKGFGNNGKAHPFPHWQLRNFVDNSENVVEKIEEELQNFESWTRKENDLYSLHQTDDLKSLNEADNPAICSFRTFLNTKVKEWLQKTSHVELIEQVDCNGSLYAENDTLLPHNDLIDTRRFAFVYYLTEANWDSKTNGGDLLLFNHNENLLPVSVAARFAPLRNSLMLFEVSETSWHRVAEMISDEPRLSINGWFHSTRRIEVEQPEVEILPRFVPTFRKRLGKLISAEYLKQKRQTEVSQIFSDTSELSLKNFLVDEVHQNVYEELSANPDVFNLIGPLNKRMISRLDKNKASSLEVTNAVRKCLKSKSFADFVFKLTEVNVADAQASVTVSRVEHGSYWVLGDEDAEQTFHDGYSLDFHIFVQKEAWPEKAGGDVIYIAEGDAEELLCVTASPNMASVVFCEQNVLSFLKYANAKAADPFFLFTVSYYNVKVVD